MLGGLLVSTLVFGRIHGITIAFGATLVGVVDDYPMHLFSHARHVAPRETVRVLLRTLLVSAGTTIVAYAALRGVRLARAGATRRVLARRHRLRDGGNVLGAAEPDDAAGRRPGAR